MSKEKKQLHVRLLEIFPGTLTWATLIGAPILSYFHPVWISVYIILFDSYWFLKAANVASHLMHSYRNLKVHQQIDWREWLNRVPVLDDFKSYLKHKSETEPKLKFRRFYRDQLHRLMEMPQDRNLDWRRIYHLIILPCVTEDLEVLDSSVRSYVDTDYPKDKIIFILATEERAGQIARDNAAALRAKYERSFYKFFVVEHPDGLAGEAKVKGANITYAAKFAQKFFDENNIAYEDVLISAFDSDTTTSREYFAHLTYDFLTIDKPLQRSYQPMPFFHNNIWDAPAIARVIAISSSFWQLVEASRPDRLVTFSSHSMSFKTLADVGFWRTDLIPDDSYIFWQCFNHFNGDYKSHPLFTAVSMDAVVGETYYETLLAQYKQKRRWAWGNIQLSLVYPKFAKNKLMPLWKKLLYGYRMIEGYYFWATASIMIAILGWLPLILGGDRFGDTVLAVNLPFMTRTIMTIATFFLAFSVYVNLTMLPPRPAKYGKWRSVTMVLQWALSPIVSSVFGSLPAIDAQTRLMFGKYMEFFVTPKVRKQPLNFQPQNGAFSQRQEAKLK